MNTVLEERPAEARPANGGIPARRAVIRWAWRLFWREWRQQLLVLALIVVATAATIVGAAVAVNTPARRTPGSAPRRTRPRSRGQARRSRPRSRRCSTVSAGST